MINRELLCKCPSIAYSCLFFFCYLWPNNIVEVDDKLNLIILWYSLIYSECFNVWFHIKPCKFVTYIYHLGLLMASGHLTRCSVLTQKESMLKTVLCNNSRKANCTKAYQVGFHHWTLRFKSIDYFVRNFILNFLCWKGTSVDHMGSFHN